MRVVAGDDEQRAVAKGALYLAGFAVQALAAERAEPVEATVQHLRSLMGGDEGEGSTERAGARSLRTPAAPEVEVPFPPGPKSVRPLWASPMLRGGALVAGVLLLAACAGGGKGQCPGESEDGLVDQIQEREAWGDDWPFRTDSVLLNCDFGDGQRILSVDVGGETLALHQTSASFFDSPLADTVMVGDANKRKQALERLQGLAARTCDEANIAPRSDTPPD